MAEQCCGLQIVCCAGYHEFVLEKTSSTVETRQDGLRVLYSGVYLFLMERVQNHEALRFVEL